MRIAALLIQLVMPDSAAETLDLLGQPGGAARDFTAVAIRLVPGGVTRPTGSFAISRRLTFFQFPFGIPLRRADAAEVPRHAAVRRPLSLLGAK